MYYDFSSCTLCPHNCHADRTSGVGFCGEEHKLRAAKAYLHMWEEPCLSGDRGSGTVFFSGCVLKCKFCQNYKISSENFGKEISEHHLGEIFLDLQNCGAHNINLVSPTQFIPQIINALDLIKPQLKIPVVYNTGGYEKPETLKLLDGYIDIYLPDFKYYDNSLAMKYSSVPDYLEICTSAISEMLHQVGKPIYDNNNILQKGVIIRHLTLPTHRFDSVRVLEEIKSRFGTQDIILSLMSQYTPDFYLQNREYVRYKNLERKLTAFEYNSVLGEAVKLGFSGYFQHRDSANSAFTPDF